MRYTLRLLIVACVLVTTFAAGRWAQAQAPSLRPQTPTVLSGNDIGFRVDGRKGNTPIGVLVVRINGQWVEAGTTVGTQRLTAK
jgi:hypothetical protein